MTNFFAPAQKPHVSKLRISSDDGEKIIISAKDKNSLEVVQEVLKNGYILEDYSGCLERMAKLRILENEHSKKCELRAAQSTFESWEK